MGGGRSDAFTPVSPVMDSGTSDGRAALMERDPATLRRDIACYNVGLCHQTGTDTALSVIRLGQTPPSASLDRDRRRPQRQSGQHDTTQDTDPVRVT